MKTAVVVMSRVPRAGRTKTRLMTKLSGEDCAAFHRSCLSDIGQAIIDSGLPGYIFYTGDYTGHDFHFLPEDDGKYFKICPQKGNNLGERLYNAGLEVKDVFDAVLFVGSDLPDLSPKLLLSAVEKLRKHDVVIGPARDGGYYLLGMKQIIRDIFQDIPWGTPQVLTSTVRKLECNELSYTLLDTRADIDTWADMVGFYIRGQGVGNDYYRQMAAYMFVEKMVEKYITGEGG
jgi:rSAM/selenodomain-associated transferase 1